MWTEQWPTKPGYYWFYGWPFKDRDDKPKLHFVEVWKEGAFVTNGHFLYKSEGGEGYWMPVETPTPPKAYVIHSLMHARCGGIDKWNGSRWVFVIDPPTGYQIGDCMPEEWGLAYYLEEEK